MTQPAALKDFFSIGSHAHQAVPSGRRPLWDLFAEGLSVELSGMCPGKLSVAARLVARAMQAGEPVVWITPREAAMFYPPDLEALGIDLDALTIVRMPAGAGGHGLVRAAEVVLRAGAFGLVVVDLSQGTLPRGSLAWQSRLSGLVRLHGSRLLLITSSPCDAPSIGPLISLRLEPALGAATDTGRAVLLQRMLKNKLGLAVEPSPDVRRLPAGASAH
jgi:hypothetical protein